MRDPGPETGPRATRVVAVAAGAVVVLVLAVLGAGSSWGPVVTVLPAEPVTMTPPPPPVQSAGPLPTLLPEDQPLPEPFVVPDWVGELLFALAVAVAVGLVVWFVMALRRALRPAGLRRAVAAAGTAVEVPEIDEEEVALSLGATLASLRSGMAVDHAVVECWRRLEQIAADAGIPRNAAQTSEEFTVEILAHAVVDDAALGALASLYRRAMFSTHVLTDADRRRAIDSVAALAAQFHVEVGGDGR